MGHNQQQQQEEKDVADLVTVTVMEHQREERGYDDPNEEAERHARMRALDIVESEMVEARQQLRDVAVMLAARSHMFTQLVLNV